MDGLGIYHLLFAGLSPWLYSSPYITVCQNVTANYILYNIVSLISGPV